MYMFKIRRTNRGNGGRRSLFLTQKIASADSALRRRRRRFGNPAASERKAEDSKSKARPQSTNIIPRARSLPVRTYLIRSQRGQPHIARKHSHRTTGPGQPKAKKALLSQKSLSPDTGDPNAAPEFLSQPLSRSRSLPQSDPSGPCAPSPALQLAQCGPSAPLSAHPISGKAPRPRRPPPLPPGRPPSPPPPGARAR
jgi:hypothetical protein